MFGTQTRLFVVAVVALLACTVTTVVGEEKMFVAEFTEYRPDLGEYSSLTGTLYYYYNSDHPEVSLLNFKYSVKDENLVPVEVSNLYFFEKKAMYSMCANNCTGEDIVFRADPWYVTNADGDSFYSKEYEEGNSVWYKRKSSSSDSLDPQVFRIRVRKNDNSLEKIIFRDNREVTIDKVLSSEGYTKDSDVFKLSEKCSDPSCPSYGDIVFVLDNSNSLNKNDWEDTKSFVLAVLDKFDIGPDAVQAAIIQFNGQLLLQPYEFDANYAYKHDVTPCDRNKGKASQWCGRMWTDPPAYSYSSSAYATENDGRASFLSYGETEEYVSGYFWGIEQKSRNKTVTGQREVLENGLKNKPNSGSTCQAYGLELALNAFTNSTRRNEPGLPRFVIAVTDGEDKCPNRTRYAAGNLTEYGAFIFEIGVGMQNGCCEKYDTEFLESIASDLDSFGTHAYFPVQSYSAITTIVDKIKKPMCDRFNGASKCGPLCHGFCGCGKCFCPTCDRSPENDKCQQIGCSADSDGAGTCVLDTVDCSEFQDACNKDHCDPQTGKCVAKDCTSLKQANPQKCRDVVCEAGGCVVKPNNLYCNTVYREKVGRKCVEYLCAKEDREDMDPDTGCYVSVDHVSDLEKKLAKERKTCFKAVCDDEKGAIEQENCPVNPNCYTSKCEKVDGSYQCVKTEVDKPAETKCKYEYDCFEEGWKPKKIITDDDCVNKLAQQYFEENGGSLDEAKKIVQRCTDIKCIPDDGCVPILDEDCNCMDDQVCKKEAKLRSAGDDQCIISSCNLVLNDQGVSVDECDYSKTVNCLTEMEEAARKQNLEDTSDCVSPKCVVGGCKLVSVGSHEKNVCLDWKCEMDEKTNVWGWKSYSSKIAEECESNDCVARECHPINGCVKKDTLCGFVDAEKCVDRQCVDGECIDVPLAEDTYCRKHSCVTDDEGVVRIVWEDKDLTKLEECKTTDKCHVAVCKHNADETESHCEIQELNEATCRRDHPEICNKPCKKYTCKPEDGTFEESDLCDDNDGCTVNRCDVSTGVCNFNKLINCYEEISMEAYSCFTAKCKSQADPKTGNDYQCVRKLMNNAYIDICGNCIAEPDPEAQGSAASSTGQTVAAECVDAPAKPLLQEGLAAASIALIIVAAVIIGAGIAASGIAGTKTLMNRAKGADNQSAHTNPLFEDNEAEMSNPAYVGE